MAVRAHRRDHELADTLTMLRSRVGYTQHKFHQAASLLHLPSRVNLCSPTRWSEAARSNAPRGSQCPRHAPRGGARSEAHCEPRGARGGTGRPDTPRRRSRATAIASSPIESWPPPKFARVPRLTMQAIPASTWASARDCEGPEQRQRRRAGSASPLPPASPLTLASPLPPHRSNAPRQTRSVGQGLSSCCWKRDP